MISANLSCTACFVRQACDIIMRMAVDPAINLDPAIAEKAMKAALTALVDSDLGQPPPILGRGVHAAIREISGVADPYLEVKKKSTSLALGMVGEAKTMISLSKDRFHTACELAVAGNIMDFAMTCSGTERLAECLAMVDGKRLDKGKTAELRDAVAAAINLLVIGDNAGETVFDRLLIETIVDGRTRDIEVTYAVKGSPVLNDATAEDAVMAGLDGVAKIIANGNDYPGTVLEKCSADFLALFESADLVIAKGQANLETLCDASKKVWHLLQVKCPHVAERFKSRVGDWVITTNH